MTASEVYKPPFHHDGTMIWSANNVMAIMAADCHQYPDKLIERTCQILNGEVKSNGNPQITYVNGEIFNGPQLLLVIRGFGYLTGSGGLNLPLETAIKIQDEFGEWVCRKLRNQE